MSKQPRQVEMEKLCQWLMENKPKTVAKCNCKHNRDNVYNHHETAAETPWQQYIEEQICHCYCHKGNSLIHGDFKLSNVIFDEHELKIIGIVDWEHASIGPCAFDLANLCQIYHLPQEFPAYRGLVFTSGTNLHTNNTMVEHKLREYYRSMGIPTESQMIQWYLQARQVPLSAVICNDNNDVNNWLYSVTFACFRHAALLQELLTSMKFEKKEYQSHKQAFAVITTSSSSTSSPSTSTSSTPQNADVKRPPQTKQQKKSKANSNNSSSSTSPSPLRIEYTYLIYSSRSLAIMVSMEASFALAIVEKYMTGTTNKVSLCEYFNSFSINELVQFHYSPFIQSMNAQQQQLLVKLLHTIQFQVQPIEKLHLQEFIAFDKEIFDNYLNQEELALQLPVAKEHSDKATPSNQLSLVQTALLNELLGHCSPRLLSSTGIQPKTSKTIFHRFTCQTMLMNSLKASMPATTNHSKIEFEEFISSDSNTTTMCIGTVAEQFSIGVYNDNMVLLNGNMKLLAGCGNFHICKYLLLLLQQHEDNGRIVKKNMPNPTKQQHAIVSPNSCLGGMLLKLPPQDLGDVKPCRYELQLDHAVTFKNFECKVVNNNDANEIISLPQSTCALTLSCVAVAELMQLIGVAERALQCFAIGNADEVRVQLQQNRLLILQFAQQCSTVTAHEICASKLGLLRATVCNTISKLLCSILQQTTSLAPQNQLLRQEVEECLLKLLRNEQNKTSKL